MREDETSREILIVFSEGNRTAAEEVERGLAPVDYPVSLRNQKWGFDSDMYMLVIHLGDEREGGADSNVVSYDMEAIRENAEEDPVMRLRDLPRRRKEKKVGEKALQMIKQDIQGAV